MKRYKIAITILIAAVITSMVIASLPGGATEVATAESVSLDFSSFRTLTSNAELVKQDGNSFIIGDGETPEVVNYVSFSNKTFDFSRSFEIKGSFKGSTAPDGVTVAFQPENHFVNQDPVSHTRGSSLCVYDIEGLVGLARRALVAEVDTYRSISTPKTDYLDTNDPERPKDPLPIPHVSICEIDANNSESLVPGAYAAFDIKDGKEENFEISWIITDKKTLRGTYKLTCGNAVAVYENFDPKTLFGTYDAYMVLTGSVNFTSNYPKNPWVFRLNEMTVKDRSKVSVKPEAQVEFNGEDPGELDSASFTLTDSDGKVIETSRNSGREVAFNNIEFTRPGTYTYYIDQVKGSENGVTYDTARAVMTVTVKAEGDELAVTTGYTKAGKSGVPLFSNEAEPPELVITEKSNMKGKKPAAGEIITYTVTVKNRGEGDARGLWMRRYMPKHTTFYSVGKKGSGRYGCVDRKEFCNWYVKRLSAGQSIKLTYKIRVNGCKPEDLRISKKIYYQVLDSSTVPFENQKKRPGKSDGK